ncbi:hypothetical protein QOZ98_000872 [Planomicrobium stackebrandtii]|uniref:DUF4025 domain-containing protein n=1 Tax=Planomicrobium stackebrandtii TaxID=253160 RepID=A0ABU0GTF6_9BACL|nr:hypothetical protein [Planomicrobium stackebrandtii]MDQ0428046.1 hypothetical protein [Planomicrobium stackebrandtii]
MGKEENEQQNSEKLKSASANSSNKETHFNVGGNDSDYDGGHPEDASVQNRKPDEMQQEDSTNDSYNSGGNDSDYDGGHPEDVHPKNKGK